MTQNNPLHLLHKKIKDFTIYIEQVIQMEGQRQTGKKKDHIHSWRDFNPYGRSKGEKQYCIVLGCHAIRILKPTTKQQRREARKERLRMLQRTSK
jgi:hypothetical protein